MLRNRYSVLTNVDGRLCFCEVIAKRIAKAGELCLVGDLNPGRPDRIFHSIVHQRQSRVRYNILRPTHEVAYIRGAPIDPPAGPPGGNGHGPEPVSAARSAAA